MFFCESTFSNSYKRTRHSLKHLPWFFGNNLCVICEVKFDSTPRLFEHCTSNPHAETVKLNKQTIDVVQERQNFARSADQGVNTAKYLEELVQKKYTTNFDRSDGILDCVDLFPNSPVKMNTPEQDNNQPATSLSPYAGMLPTESPRMPSVITDPDTTDFSVIETNDGEKGVCLTARSHDCSQVEELPEPPLKPAKHSRTSTTPSCSEDKQCDKLMSKLCALEHKLDSLSKKVVDTAESQSADLKVRLSRLEDSIESNCANTQSYSKSLAVFLQKDISKVLDTVRLIQETENGPKMSPVMLSALVTLSKEAVKLYEVPYRPQEPAVPANSAI